MGARRKLSMPVPEALLSPLVLPGQVRVLEMEIVLPAPRDDNQERFEQIVRQKAAEALEEALESLRLDGASEQQLGAIMGSTRLECLMRLLDLDLEGIVLEHVATGGATRPLREVIASVLVPELDGML
jgi:hypothetical protein